MKRGERSPKISSSLVEISIDQAIKGDSNGAKWNDSQVLQLNLFDWLQSATDESVRAANGTTWNDKLITLAKDTQKQKSF